MKQKKTTRPESGIRELNVLDLILIDHQFIKECIDVFKNDDADKRKKYAMARSFLEALSLHSSAEKKAIYSKIESNKELHFHVLEAQVEHDLIDQKVKSLKAKLTRVRSMKEGMEAEFKVLSELVRHHLMEEESELLPLMQEFLDDETLKDLGKDFMTLRKFTAKELGNYPQLHDELIIWKDSIQKLSSEFLTKMDKFVENIQH